MKKIFTVILISQVAGIFAQTTTPEAVKDTSWKTSGFFGITGSKTELSNWQGGGQNNLALNGIFNFEAVYKRDQFEQWTNKIDAQYGLIRPGDVRGFRQNNDQLFVLSKYNTKAFGKSWFYAAQADYRTQFSPGYTYRGDTISGPAVSDFNSPGYIQGALGLDFKPTDYFSAMIAPIAGKITMVNRQYLADAGAYGVDKAEIDKSGNITTPGKKIRYEVGGRIIIKFKKDIFKNCNYDSYLDLFTNYLDKPGNVDVIFNNLLTFKITKIFTASIICQMVYDDDIRIKRDLNGDGIYDKPGEFNGPRLQVLTTYGFGLGYKF
jgi:hypothetical protein